MNKIIIEEENIQKHIDRLSKIGNIGTDPKDGFLRAGWSDEESEAFAYIKSEADNLNLYTKYDEIGNLYVRTPYNQNHQQIIQVGSHMDTVPVGGNYDGAAGIIAGLEAINIIYESDLPIEKYLELVIWRGEESATYNAAYKGSMGAFGELLTFKDETGRTTSILRSTFKGKTLEQAIKEQGFDPTYIERGQPTLSQKEIDAIYTHLELHIEQGNILEQNMKDIGIVTSIRGPKRYAIEMPDTTNDLPTANLLQELDILANSEIEQGTDLVQTAGVINNRNIPKDSPLEECAITKVSGYCEVTLNKSYDSIKHIIAEITGNLEVTAEHERTDSENSTLLKITGEFDHSGATPMGKYRHDANLAAVHIINYITHKDNSLIAHINYPDNNSSFLLEIRGNNTESRDTYTLNAIDLIKRLYPTTRIKELSSSDPVEHLDSGIQEAIKHSCNTLNYSQMKLPSGAGHDAATIAKQKHSDGNYIPTGIIFIPCKGGKSHCKEEFTTCKAITKGANVLAQTLYDLARTGN